MYDLSGSWTPRLFATPDQRSSDVTPIVAQSSDVMPKRHPTSRSVATYNVSKANDDNTLDGIVDLPLDIIYEIFGHLAPIDLLSMARTSKGLRNVLMARHNTRYIWRSALASVDGLPPCPPDMSEPHYARLAFDEICHFCFATGVKDVLWVCRVRCCSECRSHLFVAVDELRSWAPELCVEDFELALPTLAVYHPHAKDHSTRLYFYPYAEQCLLEASQIREKETLSKWIEAKRQLLQERIEHAVLCARWHNQWVGEASPTTMLRVPLSEICLTLGLSVALVYMWKDHIF